jgi:hypothetical protein
MAEEKKKTKIDLKARLGKTQTGMGSAVPLPVPGAPASSPQSGAPAPPSSDGVPAPAVPAATPSVRPAGGIAPPAGISPGIPLPPFAQRPSQREAAPKPTAAQQTIKVEVGEEIHEERKKASKRTALFAVLAAALGIGIGFFVGGAKERSDKGQLAVKAAGDLEKEVKAANEKLKELSEKLVEANEKLGKKEYPAELANALGGLNIPFDASNLEKPGVGNMGKTLRALMKYASGVQDLNDNKDKIKGWVTSLQAGVEKSWKEEKEPVVNFSVVFRPEGGKGMMAELVPNKDPFKIAADFPKEYTVIKPEKVQGQIKGVEKKAKRWEKGDLTGNDPIAIPVSPDTTAVFADKVINQLRLKLIEPTEIILGKDKGLPSETAGLLKEGEDLEHDLHKLALAK